MPRPPREILACGLGCGVVAPVNGTLKELGPDQGGKLAYRAILGHRDVDHHDLAVENVVGAEVGCRAEEFVNLAAGERIEHPGKNQRQSCRASSVARSGAHKPSSPES